MNIAYSGTPSLPDHLAMNRLARRAAVPRAHPLYRVFFVAATATALIAVACAASINGRSFPWFLASAVCLAVSTFLLSAERRGIAADTKARAPRHGQITDSGFTICTDDSTSALRWEAISSAAISNDAVVLLSGTSLYFGFPRSFFSSASDWDTVVAFVTDRFPPPPKPDALPTLSHNVPRWALAITIILALLFFVIVVYVGGA